MPALAPSALNCDQVINLAAKQQYLTNQQHKEIITRNFKKERRSSLFQERLK